MLSDARIDAIKARAQALFSGLTDEQAIEEGMREKSAEFTKQGAEVYTKA